MSDFEKSEDEFDSDVGEDELDEELALPDVLRSISYDEKRELYRFKRTHNERDWEEEMLRRSDLLARKIDMERLKRMSGKAIPAPAVSKAAPKKAEKAPARDRRKVQSSDEEGEESGEDEQSESEEEERAGAKRKAAAKKGSAPKKVAAARDSDFESDEEGEASESDEGSDLFDSEEEEAISKGLKAGKTLGGKRKAAAGSAEDSDSDGGGRSGKGRGPAVSTRSSRRSVTRQRDSESEEGEESDVDDEEEELYGRKLSKKTGKGRGLDDDGEDTNLARIKQGGRGPSGSGRGKAGYDSDGSGAGRGGAGRGAGNKPLTVQEQLQADLAALMESDSSPLAELVDYLPIQPRRTDMIMKWLNEPFLKPALEGLYVRYSVGEVNGRAVCRMCKVVNVDLHGKGYRLMETGEWCTVRLSLLCGGQVRKLMRVCQVSNSRITQDEFDFYWATNEKAQREGKTSDQRLTKNQARAVRKLLLSHTVHHVYTDAEIKAMVKKSVGLDKSKVTEYSTAIESLEKRLAQARESLDYDTMEVVQKTLDAVKSRFNHEKEKYDKATARQVAVNRRMKEINTLRDIAAGNRLRAENLEAAARGVQSKQEADPFSRRETRPKILWNTGKRLETARLPEGSVAPVSTTDATETAADGSATSAADTTAPCAGAGKPAWKIAELPTIEQIRRRVKQRLGVDPIYEAGRSARERYLERVCAGLPPVNSVERALLRQQLDAKSLEEALISISEASNDAALLEQEGAGSAMEIAH